jgi:hypothetical protein
VGGGEREGVGWVVREGVGAGGRNDPSMYAHMNNKNKLKKKMWLFDSVVVSISQSYSHKLRWQSHDSRTV